MAMCEGQTKTLLAKLRPWDLSKGMGRTKEKSRQLKYLKNIGVGTEGATRAIAPSLFS